jgi:formylglycine-generating enzyme required for sulfatase activity
MVLHLRFCTFVLGSIAVGACAASTAKEAPPDTVPGSSDMVTIKTGAFTMGDRNGQPHEYPERMVQVRSFRIDQMEVSNQAYEACVRAGACRSAPYVDDQELGAPGYPVVGVTWLDANRFCAWIGKRLPTEAEWEFAAKGTDLRKWPWQGAFDPKKANVSGTEDGFAKTAPVDAFPQGASPFGVLNLAGNAAEWVNDRFDPIQYQRDPNPTDPQGPDAGSDRGVRGGSYLDPAFAVRVSARLGLSETESDSRVGFRCAK